jgi:ABC-2 type transport system permease protein
MNLHGVGAIYKFEMARMRRTLMQSVASPVISTCLYFVVFGSAIGSRMGDIDGISYGAYIIPGLVMLSLLMQSISNASFGIYMPKFSGTIYEVLSAPVSYLEVVLGYVGAAATKSMILGIIILITAKLFVNYDVLHPFWIFLGGTFYSIDMLPEVWQKISLLNPVVYLISGFRWAFYGVSDVHIGISVGMTFLFLTACMITVWWIFRTGYRLRS